MQFKLIIDDDVVKELDEAAKKYGRKSANQLAIEIITLYLPLWKDSAEAQFQVVREQKKVIKAAVPVVNFSDLKVVGKGKNRA